MNVFFKKICGQNENIPVAEYPVHAYIMRVLKSFLNLGLLAKKTEADHEIGDKCVHVYTS